MTTCLRHPDATLLRVISNDGEWFCPECQSTVIPEVSDKVLRAKYRKKKSGPSSLTVKHPPCKRENVGSTPTSGFTLSEADVKRAVSPTETQFEDAVIALAHVCHWLVEHKRPARLDDGSWRTAIQGDKGGPDLLMARNGVVIVAELKTEKGKLSPEQEAWHAAANTLIWRPSNWEEIASILA